MDAKSTGSGSTPSKKNYTLRMDPKVIDALNDMAKRRRMPTRLMVRRWILERIEAETGHFFEV